MRSSRTALVVAAVATAATAVASGTADAATRSWHIRATPRLTDGVVNSTLAFSTKNAWAFGGTGTPYTTTMAPAAYHWNGKSWRSVTLPKVIGWITASSATSPNDIWAVTKTVYGFDGYVYILHWNGKKWSVAKGDLFGKLTGVLAVSRTNVWVFAMPSDDPRGDPEPGLWHYNGRTWTRSQPAFQLSTASKVSATNIWAVGSRNTGTSPRIVAHYNGKKWTTNTLTKIIPVDRPDEESYASLTTVRASSAKSVWAAGGYSTPTSLTPILVHWNGTAWHRISVPGSGELGGITPDGHGGLWFTLNDRTPRKAVFLHRSSTGKWSTAPVTGGTLQSAGGLSLVPGTTRLWAGGALPAPNYSTTGVILSY